MGFIMYEVISSFLLDFVEFLPGYFVIFLICVVLGKVVR